MPNSNYHIAAAQLQRTELQNAASNQLSTASLLSVTLKDQHQSGLKETEDFYKQQKTITDYCLRLNKMIEWVNNKYNEYFTTIRKLITNEQKQDKLNFYKASEYDFDYSKLDPKVITAFIANHKVKSVDEQGKEKHYSFVHLRKYIDSVKHGAQRQETPLPADFELKVKTFLGTLKKESNKKRLQVNLMKMN